MHIRRLGGFEAVVNMQLPDRNLYLVHSVIFEPLKKA